AVPIVDVAANAVLFDAIPLLDLALELIALAGDLVEIVVGEFAPLLLDLALELFPVSFDAVPIHHRSPCFEAKARCMGGGLRAGQSPTSPEKVIVKKMPVGLKGSAVRAGLRELGDQSARLS